MNDNEQHKSALQILVEARELISDKDRWLKGRWVDYNHNAEISYCAMGAIDNVVGYKNTSSYRIARQALANAMAGRHIPKTRALWVVSNYNDRWYRRHKTVIKKFDDAIKGMEKYPI